MLEKCQALKMQVLVVDMQLNSFAEDATWQTCL